MSRENTSERVGAAQHEEQEQKVREDRSVPMDIMQIIYNEVRKVAHKGTLEPEMIYTENSLVSKDVLVGGDAVFHHYANLIKHAKHEIMLQTNVWESGSVASNLVISAFDELNARLAEQNLEPVNVYLIVNKLNILAKYFMRMTSDRDRDNFVRPSRNIEQVLQSKNYSHLKIHFAQYKGDTRNCLHSKYLLIDRHDAAIITANIQEYNHGANRHENIGVKVTGGCIKALLSDFKDAWGHAKSKQQNPINDKVEIKQDRVERQEGGMIKCPVLVVTHPSKNSNNNPQNIAILTAINNAQEKINIQTPNLNNEKIITALLCAIQRGVKVRIILSRRFNESRERFSGGTNESTIIKLYKRAGYHKRHLKVVWFCHKKGELKTENGRYSINHSKYMSVDGRVLIMGSANLDNGSIRFLRELNLVISSKEITRSGDELFNNWFYKSVEVKEKDSVKAGCCCFQKKISLFAGAPLPASQDGVSAKPTYSHSHAR